MVLPRLLIKVICICLALPLVATAQIPGHYGETLPGTDDITLGPNIDLSGWNQPERNLRSALFQGVDLTNASFAGSWVDRSIFGADLSNASFEDASLTDASFEDSNLMGSSFMSADLTNAGFRRSNLTGATFVGANINGVDFAESQGLTKEQVYSTASFKSNQMPDVFFADIPMQGWDFSSQNMPNAGFANVDLSDAKFTDANVTRGYFYRSDLNRVEFTGAQIAGATFEDVQGFTAQQIYSTQSYADKQLGGLRFRTLRLSGIDLSGQSLRDSDYRETNLSRANFEGADLTQATFVSSPLADSNFNDALISEASFFGRSKLTAAQLYSTASYKSGDLARVRFFDQNMIDWQMTEKDLSGSRIERSSNNGANYSGSNLNRSWMEGQSMRNVDFSNADLTHVRFERISSFQDTDFTNSTIYGTKFINSDITFSQFSSTKSFREQDLGPIEFVDTSLRDWQFENFDLTNAVYVDSNLTRASFRGANLTRATIRNARVTGADFEDAVLNQSYLQGKVGGQLSRAQLESTLSFKQKTLQRNWFVDYSMDGWDLSGQDLTDSSFSATNLRGVDFTSANLTGASFYGSSVVGAIFDDALVDGADFSEYSRDPVEMSLEQIYTTRSFRDGHLRNMRFSQTDLSGADFSGIDLTGTWLAYANLDGADFADATIESSYFSDTFSTEQLISTGSFKSGNLRNIKFYNIDLSNTDLSGQDLSESTFENVNLFGADLTDAKIEFAQFYLHGVGSSDYFSQVQLPSTRSFKERNLKGVGFGNTDFRGIDLSRFDLSGAWFDGALDGADFTDAEILGTTFSDGINSLSAEQLYSTASYKRKNLAGIGLDDMRIDGWDFSGQDLENGDFEETRFADTDFTDAFLVNTDFEDTTVVRTTFDRADLRDAEDVWQAERDSRNVIRVDGTIHGLSLRANETLIVRDYAKKISIKQDWTMAADSGLELRLRSSEWGSTITVPSDMNPQLDGTLRLTLDQDANVQELVGLTLDAFDWESAPSEASQFAMLETDVGYIWDLRDLYSTGEVTIRAVASPVSGDYDGDRQLTADDIDLLTMAIRGSFSHATFDLNADQTVNDADRLTWINDVANQWIGDANFDGEFNSSDLIAVFVSNEYEDDVAQNSTWATGDWDGDGEFASSDLVAAFQAGGYEQGLRGVARFAAVPESRSPLTVALAVGMILFGFRRCLKGRGPKNHD